MIEILKMLLDELKIINEKDTVHYNKLNTKPYICSLECAIEILEKIKYEERSVQNGNIE